MAIKLTEFDYKVLHQLQDHHIRAIKNLVRGLMQPEEEQYELRGSLRDTEFQTLWEICRYEARKKAFKELTTALEEHDYNYDPKEK